MKKIFLGIIILAIIGCTGKKIESDMAIIKNPEINEIKEMQESIIPDNNIGSWKWSLLDAVINIIKTDNGYILEQKFNDGSSRERNIELKKNINLIYVYILDDNPRGEFYIINSDGDFEFWDKEGKSSSASVIKKLIYE